MPIIPDDLNDQIRNNPEKDYSVLITLKNEVLPPSLKNKGKFVMGNKIYSANINGKELQSLSNDSEIEAIEPDVEMGVL